jgi:hypothetical protein
MQPIKFTVAHFHGMEAAFERYKEERWIGIITRPVDCLSVMYAIEEYSLVEAKARLIAAQSKASKAHQSLYNEPIESFNKLIQLTDRAQLINRLDDLINFYQWVNRETSKAQTEYEHSVNDGRKLARTGRIWEYWKEIRNSFDLIMLTEIDAAEARTLRLGLSFAKIIHIGAEGAQTQQSELSTTGTTTLYHAYIAHLHAGPTKVKLRLAGATELWEMYRNLSRSEKDGRKAHIYDKLFHDFSYIHYAEAKDVPLMDATLQVLDEWKKVLMPVLDKILVYEHNGPDPEQLEQEESEIQYCYWLRRVYQSALASLQNLTVMTVED